MAWQRVCRQGRDDSIKAKVSVYKAQSLYIFYHTTTCIGDPSTGYMKSPQKGLLV